MKAMVKSCLMMSSALLLIAPTGFAQMSVSSKASMADKHFLHEAMAGNMAEIEAAKVALNKAQSDDVKQFAQKMVDDHTKLGEEAQPVAQNAGVTPPSSPSMMDEHEISHLKGLSGSQFDNAYIKAMVKDHRQDLALFKKEAANGTDPQVKELAQKGSEVIQGHLDMITQIAQTHHVATGSSSM